MSHPLVLGLFDSSDCAAAAARALHAGGVTGEHLSVIARSHDETGELARAIDATPGVELEDSRPAALLGELGAMVVAAAAVVMPGMGTLVTAGPLAAELGEAAGHLAGGLAATLARAGIAPDTARHWEDQVRAGHVILGVHVADGEAATVERILREHAPGAVGLARWTGAS